MDLQDPDNLKSSIVYDPSAGSYLFYTKMGAMDIATPISMSSQEYSDYNFRKSMLAYWRQRNDSTVKSEDAKFALTTGV